MSIFDKIAQLITGVDSNTDKTPATSDQREAQSVQESKQTEKQPSEEKPKPSTKRVNPNPTTKKRPATQTAPKRPVQNPTQLEELKGSNLIDIINKLQQKIVDVINQNFGGGKFSFSDKKLVIWVQDNLLFTALSSDSDFIDNLITAIDNECGISIPKVEIETGKLPQGISVTPITPTIHILIREDKPYRPVHTATIRAMEEQGSLVEEVYYLSANDIMNLPGNRYNIGIGVRQKLDNLTIRTNHIAIDDNPASPEYEHNKYVSRSHAHISYDNKIGFLLYVEDGGTTRSGKRTAILRNDDTIRLESINAPIPLQDGDIIVLSKNVYLIFNEDKE